jgi:hypothetical protein
MDIRPFRRSKNRHNVRIDSPTECLVLADGISNAEYEVTPGTLDRVVSLSQLTIKFAKLADSNRFPQTLTLPTRKLEVIASGLSHRFNVLNEPRFINDPVYSEVGDDAATIFAQYITSKEVQAIGEL